MVYGRKDIAGLRLRASLGLRRLSRRELFSRMQLIRVIDPATDEAYKIVEAQNHRDQKDDSPHGHPWHVSFHASQFPGDDPMACPRAALYQLADFPAPEPFNRNARTVMAAGKAIEVELVSTWHEAGILLSAPPDEPVQTGFEHSETWLTGSVDAVILRPRTNWPTPVEIKSKYQADIDLMRVGAKGPDDKHVSQIKTQISFVRMVQQSGEWLSGLELCDHGYIYYLSRDKPSVTAEFRIDHDPTFFEAGLARLKEWKGLFLEDVLPELKPPKKITTRSHPNGWRWSYQPCQWCNFKKTCQLDHREGVTTLSESVGIERAKLVRPHYDFDEAVQRVKDRWATPIDRVLSGPVDDKIPTTQSNDSEPSQAS